VVVKFIWPEEVTKLTSQLQSRFEVNAAFDRLRYRRFIPN